MDFDEQKINVYAFLIYLGSYFSGGLIQGCPTLPEAITKLQGRHPKKFNMEAEHGGPLEEQIFFLLKLSFFRFQQLSANG